MKEAHGKLEEAVESLKIIEKMQEFDARQEKKPLFKVFRHYMRMVMEMMTFVRPVRTGDWALHLEALQAFTKYYFAHDMLNYARMIPVCLAEMGKLKETDPEIYEEFQQGNWVVNKNSSVSFCAVGADNALEHVNRSMKVSGGLIGITLNSNARTKYLLLAPELARLAEQAKEMAGTSSRKGKHHDAITSVRTRQEKNIEQLVDCINRFTNPFSEESEDLFNLVTKVVMPEKVKEDLCQQSVIGSTMLCRFVEDRIKSNKCSIWSLMKKRKLNTWKSTTKTLKVKINENVVELKEDRSLFARMCLVAKSRPEIDLKEAIGQYEFNLVPRSMFAADGSMLHCPSKSVLMNILEKLNSTPHAENTVSQNSSRLQQPPVQKKVCIIDGVAEVQALDKPGTIKYCSDLADHFVVRLFDKYSEHDELRLIFDRYNTVKELADYCIVCLLV